MVDISKLSAAQQKMLEELKTGGLDSDELAKLKKAGVNDEILKELESEFPSTGEIPSSEPTMPKNEKPSFWDEPFAWMQRDDVPLWKKAVGGVIMVCSTPFIALSALTSCSSGPGTEIKQDVDVVIKEQNYDALLKALEDNRKADDERHQEIMGILSAILANGEDIKTVVGKLVGMNTKLDQIIDLLVVNNTNTEEIIALLKELGKTNAEIFAALGDMKMEEEKQTELLEKLVDNDNINVNYLKEILAEVKKGNELDVKENNILNQILAKLDTLDKGDDSGAKILNEILAKVTAFAKQEADMDEKTHTMLHTIIENQNRMNADAKDYTAQILAKLDTMRKEDKERFEVVVPLLKNLGSDADAILNAINEGTKFTNTNLEALRDAILDGNNIAQGTQDLVKAILEKMDKLGDKADTIIDVLGKLGNGDPVDLTNIEKMLADLLEQTKANGETLSSVDNKMNFVKVTLEGIKDQVGSNHRELMAKLDAILNKIPSACNCNANLETIIGKLDDIIDNLGKLKDDPEHEGILKDLEDYFS